MRSYDGRPPTQPRRSTRAMASAAGAEPDNPGDGPLSAEATVELLDRVKKGDQEALNLLLARVIPRLRRWAHGRLPQSARGMQETADLVQDTILAAVKRIERTA